VKSRVALRPNPCFKKTPTADKCAPWRCPAPKRQATSRKGVTARRSAPSQGLRRSRQAAAENGRLSARPITGQRHSRPCTAGARRESTVFRRGLSDRRRPWEGADLLAVNTLPRSRLRLGAGTSPRSAFICRRSFFENTDSVAMRPATSRRSGNDSRFFAVYLHLIQLDSRENKVTSARRSSETKAKLRRQIL